MESEKTLIKENLVQFFNSNTESKFTETEFIDCLKLLKKTDAEIKKELLLAKESCKDFVDEDEYEKCLYLCAKLTFAAIGMESYP